MDKRSDFSAYLDGEVPEALRGRFESAWAGKAEFESFRKCQEHLSALLQKVPEPDFESRREAVFLRIEQTIREKKIMVRPKNWLSSRVRVVWAAAAVFAALIGGIFMGRLLQTLEGPNANNEEVITFQLPEGFELTTSGNPEFIQVTNYRRRP